MEYITWLTVVGEIENERQVVVDELKPDWRLSSE